jgi:hypothetical protein
MAVLVAIGLLAGFAAFAASGPGRRLLPSWARPFAAADVPGGPATERVVPPGVRITVEVLNGTDVRGLARSAAMYLRDAGFDVVYYGNTAERRDTTIVRDRRGHADWAALAREAMRPAAVEAAPDSTRLVDLSVVIGALWRPPPDPLRP